MPKHQHRGLGFAERLAIRKVLRIGQATKNEKLSTENEHHDPRRHKFTESAKQKALAFTYFVFHKRSAEEEHHEKSL